MRGVVSKRQAKREKKTSALSISDCFVVVVVVVVMVVADVCLQILLSRAFSMLCACAVLRTAAMLSNHNSNKGRMKCKALICYISSKSASMQKTPVNACAERQVWT